MKCRKFPSLFILFLLVFSPAFSDDQVRTVRVAAFDFYPIIFTSETGNREGIYVDILSVVAQEKNWKIDYIPVSFAEGLQMLQSGELDLLTSMRQSEERDLIMDFNEENVLTTWGEVYAPSASDIQTILDLDGKKVGMMSEDNNAENFMTLCRTFGIEPDFIEFTSFLEVKNAILSGEADAGVFASIFSYQIDDESRISKTPILFSPAKSLFAVAEGENGDLLEAIDEVLAELKSDPHSAYYESLEYWAGTDSYPDFILPSWVTQALFVAVILILFLSFLTLSVRYNSLKERQKLQEQLFQSQKMESIGVLAGGIAHDFNNLLTVILGYADVILFDEDLKDSVRESVDEIQNASQKAAFLTKQLLTFSRQQVDKPSVIDLNTLVLGSEKILSRLLPEYVDLEIHLREGTLPVLADETQLIQTLMNLVINSRDALAEGGKILLRTDRKEIDPLYCKNHTHAQPGEYARLNVEDNGSGMEKKILANIFDPFFTTKEKGKGTGLGLSVVYGIMLKLGGWIDVYSEPGSGSRFSLYFPLYHEDAKSASKNGRAVLLNAKHEKILLIEDEASVRKYTQKALRKLGFRIETASSCKQAKEIFNRKKEDFRIVMSDVVLSDGNGVDLVLKFVEERPELKVLCYSAYADVDSRLGMIKSSGFEFLPKPFSLKELSAELEKLMDQLAKTD